MQPSGVTDPAWYSGFSRVAGGHLYRLLCRTGLVRDGAPVLAKASAAVFLVAFAPVLLLAGVEWVASGRTDALLTDFSVFTRFAVAIPLFFFAERALHERCARTIGRFVRGNFLDAEGLVAVERSLRRAERLRDLKGFEPVLIALALALGQASLWGLTGLTGAFEGGAHTREITPARLWYAVIALPTFQFLWIRWLWRWAIWSRVLFDFARLRLRLMATHPDRMGGLDLLSDPTYAFAFFVAGSNAVVAASWATRMELSGASVKDFAVPYALLVVCVMLLAYVPLLAFLPAMVRGRYGGVRDYSELALLYTREFDRRWLASGTDESPLGSPDIQSLADLQGSYQSMYSMRVVPFSPRSMLTVAAGALLPMLPLVVLEVPLHELLLKLGKALFVGLPG